MNGTITFPLWEWLSSAKSGKLSLIVWIQMQGNPRSNTYVTDQNMHFKNNSYVIVCYVSDCSLEEQIEVDLEVKL